MSVSFLPHNTGNTNISADGEINLNVFNADAEATSVTTDYYEGNAVIGGRPNPILEPENAKYFIVCAKKYSDLAKSIKVKKWWVEEEMKTRIEEVSSWLSYATANSSLRSELYTHSTPRRSWLLLNRQ